VRRNRRSGSFNGLNNRRNDLLDRVLTEFVRGWHHHLRRGGLFIRVERLGHSWDLRRFDRLHRLALWAGLHISERILLVLFALLGSLFDFERLDRGRRDRRRSPRPSFRRDAERGLRHPH